MEYDVLAFIGRFMPFHNGHKAVVDEALRRAKKVAIVIGSDQQPRTARNPFTTQERIEMISACYPQEVAEGRIHFAPQVDHPYSMDRWIAGVQGKVTQVANTPFTPDPVRIGLIGHSKDHSSFYLSSFPSWESVEVSNVRGINATDLRRAFFDKTKTAWDYAVRRNCLPQPVADWLEDWHGSDAYQHVKEEHKYVQRYKEEWAAAPYPPTFVTADAVVVQSGHVLLVKRKMMPGKGLWALPGGFVDQYETFREAAIRELKEETRIAVSPTVLNRCVTSWRVFEDPYRSQRGRTITTAFKIDLRNETKLPKIKGSDDAEKAVWVPISNLSREVMFEDHYEILETMVPF